jgi:L-seryl-tRNA(Ser) seleniumtransferase
MLRAIPKVDRMLKWPEICDLRQKHPRPAVLAAVRKTCESLRLAAADGRAGLPAHQAEITAMVRSELERSSASSLRTVINGTGVLLHTNLGRSPLAKQAEEAILSVASGYSNLEFNLENGSRGTRCTHVEALICELTGAEAALVVNNNAAAVLLALSALAAGREVIVSRGELVEIGGSFRIPDVMRQSGALLMEVGATNRTHPKDYRSAISPATSMLLKVHTSNFAIVGFTAETSVSELARIGRESSIPVMVDAGSGSLIDLSSFGMSGEPTIAAHIAAGADLVTFSGDKLLGGPQAGIIAGKREYLEPIKQHPLLRAVRIDKLTLAALEATLRLYRDPRHAMTSIPTIRMLTIAPEELNRRAGRFIRQLRRKLPPAVQLLKRAGVSSVGGGSYPLLQLPTTLIELKICGASPQQIEASLRNSTPAVLGRINNDRYILDIRTVQERELPQLLEAITGMAASMSGGDQ